MNAYRAEDIEAARTRDLLQDWAGEGYITAAQRERMEQDTVCALRRTNIFLRAVLFFFTKIIAGAAAGLFFVLFLPHASSTGTGVVLLAMAGALYWAAEHVVAEKRLYRHGIEEALACGAVLALSVGLAAVWHRDGEVMALAAGAGAAWWLWQRFGFPYALPAAMLLAAWIPGYWTKTPGVQQLAVAALYAAGLAVVMQARGRHRWTYLNEQYALAEALLWFGVYCGVNLPLSSFNHARPGAVPPALFWFTWVLTWCLPPLVLWRGVKGKDRAVIIAGMVTAVLTLATNKTYLGWERHAWDPMLLGLLLAGTALGLRRWLEAGGPDGVRAGFTARRLSGKDQAMLDAGGAALGMAAPGLTAAHPTPAHDGAPQFGGGQSGGGGASSDF